MFIFTDAIWHEQCRHITDTSVEIAGIPAAISTFQQQHSAGLMSFLANSTIVVSVMWQE